MIESESFAREPLSYRWRDEVPLDCPGLVVTRDYADYPNLAGLYLEDSYVIDIIESASEVKFLLEAVLTPEHSRYHSPTDGEQHCYVDGELVFTEVRSVEWLDQSLQSFKDATGNEDLGNIDSLTSSDGAYSVSGDWGRVRIRSNAEPEFRISLP
ncbi:hypothetical protein ABZ942_25860 [Nocardia sp. NPDC046473]|uniref:hypothetical protein n=1 Tax=Nocardia sp. NPDC046473 TaxID=3155733 RepID=UPI0033EE80AA